MTQPAVFDDVSWDNGWNYYGTIFHPGDKVRVVRIEEDFAPNGMGEGKMWLNQWVHKLQNDPPYISMDEAVGLAFEINDIDSLGVWMAGYTGSTVETFAYPLSALEKL